MTTPEAINAVMKQKRGTAAEMASVNPVLDSGEIGFEEDTKIIKIGDGVTHWVDLVPPYVPISSVAAKGDLLVGSGNQEVSVLSRGSTGQRLTVNPDGSLGWTNMPDLSNFITTDDAERRIVIKPADERRAATSAGTPELDQDLIMGVEPSTYYAFKCVIFGNCEWPNAFAGSGINFRFVFPDTGFLTCLFKGSVGDPNDHMARPPLKPFRALGDTTEDITFTASVYAGNSPGDVFVEVDGFLNTGAFTAPLVGGLFGIEWATTNGNSGTMYSTVYAHSFMTLRKLVTA